MSCAGVISSGRLKMKVLRRFDVDFQLNQRYLHLARCGPLTFVNGADIVLHSLAPPLGRRPRKKSIPCCNEFS